MRFIWSDDVIVYIINSAQIELLGIDTSYDRRIQLLFTTKYLIKPVKKSFRQHANIVFFFSFHPR